jgi:hypothetical protein
MDTAEKAQNNINGKKTKEAQRKVEENKDEKRGRD